MDTTLVQKENLRRDMLKKRAVLDRVYKKEYDQWICQQLEKIINEDNHRVIHTYLPMGKEINIYPLIEKLLKKNITVVASKTLPRRELEHRILTSLGDLEKGVFGTSHPKNPLKYTQSYDLIIVPGLAYDEYNYRLGYGGGYYDTFMAHHRESRKIGIFYPFQKVDTIPKESHDIQLDQVICKCSQ